MHTIENKVYPYKAKTLFILGATVFFSLMTYLCLQDAQHNHRGLIINHIIELSPQSATDLYWVFFLFFLLLAALSVLILLSILFKDEKQISLSASSITVPKNVFSNTYIEIPYKAILSLQLYKYKKYRTLIISHNKGKFNLSELMLPSKAVFEEICELIEERTHGQTHGLSKIPDDTI